MNCVAYSPDGKTIAIAAGGTVSLPERFDRRVGRSRLAHSGYVLSIAFSRDGRLLATGTYEKSVQIWDVATGKPIGQPIPQPDMVNSVEFSRDGRWLLAATGFRDHWVPARARLGSRHGQAGQSSLVPSRDDSRRGLHAGRAVRDHGRLRRLDPLLGLLDVAGVRRADQVAGRRSWPCP